MRKRLLTVLLALCMAVSMLPATVLAAKFDDIEGHWGADAIERWADCGVLNGREDGSFDPNKQMTRAEFATMLVNLMGYTKTSEEVFEDVPADAWYAEAISKLVAAGVMNGVGDGKVDPEGEITREQAAVMLCRAFGLKPSESASLSFSDSGSVSSWAVDAMAALAERGMINGVGENLLAPGGLVNRATAAQLTSNMVAEYITEDTVITGEVKGVVIVAKGAKVEIKDAVLSAPLVVESAEVFLTNTKAEDVRIAGEKSAFTTDEKSSVADVSMSGEGPKAELKGEVTGAVTIESGAASADVTVPNGTEVSNNSSAEATVNGKTVAAGDTSKPEASDTPSVPSGGGSGGGSIPPDPDPTPTPTRKPTPEENIPYPDPTVIPTPNIPDQTGKPGDQESEGADELLTDEHTEHTYTQKLEDQCVPATCTSFGKNVFKCTGCAATKTVATDKTAHVASEVKVQANCKAPGCKTQGYDSFKCQNCDAIARVETIPATGDHTYSTGWAANDYKHYHQCTVCGEKEHTGDTLTDESAIEYDHFYQYKNIDATKHRWTCAVCGKSKEEPHSPAEDGLGFNETQHYFYCNCGEKTNIEDHNWVDDEKNAGGQVCSVCGKGRPKPSEPETPPAHQHDYQWDGNEGADGHHTLVCADCPIEGEESKTETCTDKAEPDGTCSVCGGAIPADSGKS